VTLFLFSSEEEFNAISAFDNISQQRWAAGGQYQRADSVGYALVGDLPLRLAAVALTEVLTHHLVRQCLPAGRAERHFWVGQGLASFIGLLKPARKGEIDLSRFERGTQAGGGGLWISHSTRFLDELDAVDKIGKMPDLAAFLTDQWEEMDELLANGLSWVMVHYLLNAGEGKNLPIFNAWLKSPAPESGAGPSIIEALGRTARAASGRAARLPLRAQTRAMTEGNQQARAAAAGI